MKISVFFVALFCTVSLAFSQETWNIFKLDNWKNDSLIAPTSGMVYNSCLGFAIGSKEYAVVGSTEGIHFFEVGEDNRLYFIDFVAGRYADTQVVHRSFQVYKNYLYAVCGEGHSSLQIIDLHYLPDSVTVLVDNDSLIGTAHRLVIDTVSSLMYACSVVPSVGLPISYPLKVYSLTDSLQPLQVYAGPLDISNVEDVFVKNDTVFMNCGTNGLRIYDFSDSTNPYWIGALSTYQDQGYNKSGWFSPDGKWYYFVDETEGRRVKKIDVTDWGNPVVTTTFGTGYENNSMAANVVATNNLVYVAYHEQGLRIYDTRFQPPKEIANFDTYPEDTPNKLSGTCDLYTQLPSGRFLVSDRKYGLFLLQFNTDLFEQSAPKENFSYYPNPIRTNGVITFRFFEDGVSSIAFQLYDKTGKVIYSTEFQNQNYWQFHCTLAAGTYPFSIQYKNISKEDSYHYGQLLVVEE